MRKLFDIDLNDYKDCTSVYERHSARSIIIRDNKVAMVHSLKYDFYKFPGGGIESDETPETAMIRETLEEAGLAVIPETVQPFGMIHRIQKSEDDPNVCFIQDNYYFLCEAEDEYRQQNLDEYERIEEYTLEFADPVLVIEKNRNVKYSPYHPVMFEREAKVLEILCSEGYIK